MKPHCEKSCLRDSRSDSTQTSLLSYKKFAESLKYGLRFTRSYCSLKSVDISHICLQVVHTSRRMEFSRMSHRSLRLAMHRLVLDAHSFNFTWLVIFYVLSSVGIEKIRKFFQENYQSVK